jgi:hypothetical protein
MLTVKHEAAAEGEGGYVTITDLYKEEPEQDANREIDLTSISFDMLKKVCSYRLKDLNLGLISL